MSTMMKMIADFEALRIILIEEDDFTGAMICDQMISYVNNCHSKSSADTVAYVRRSWKKYYKDHGDEVGTDVADMVTDVINSY